VAELRPPLRKVDALLPSASYPISIGKGMVLPSVQMPLPETPYSSNRVLSTERTILSPFTKEYRALGTLTGIPLFLDCPSRGPSIQTQPGRAICRHL
jgi:hypothetical protein